MTEKEMWNLYKKLEPTAKDYSAWAFGGLTQETSDNLSQLVLKGIKTATASNYKAYEYEKEPLPPVFGLNLILNSKGEAVCITKTTKVYIVPFNKVSAEHAAKEGEGDKSLNFWRECHKKVFTKELEDYGEKFSDEMPVVLEEFEVVFPKQE